MSQYVRTWNGVKSLPCCSFQRHEGRESAFWRLKSCETLVCPNESKRHSLAHAELQEQDTFVECTELPDHTNIVIRLSA